MRDLCLGLGSAFAAVYPDPAHFEADNMLVALLAELVEKKPVEAEMVRGSGISVLSFFIVFFLFFSFVCSGGPYSGRAYLEQYTVKFYSVGNHN